MNDLIGTFERVVRKASQYTSARSVPVGGLHPFDERNIHPKFPDVVRDLFDDGHYAQATFEAFKFLEKEVLRHSGSKKDGYSLMMQVFALDAPLIKLNDLLNKSEKDEQQGFQYIFAGSVLAIRNPRAHEFGVIDSPDECLDHLSLASLLVRRLEEAGFK